MKKHVSFVRDGYKPFKCESCNYSCAQKSNMYKHAASVHEQEKSHLNVNIVITLALKNMT